MNFLRFIPHKLALSFGRLIGRLLHLILWKKVDRCEARCVKSLGIGITSAREIVRKSFMNLGMSAVEFIRLPKIISNLNKYIDYPEDSKKVLRQALSRGNGVILMSSHMANWELTAAILIQSGFELHAVYTPQRDKNAEAIISDVRTNTMKMKMIDNHKSLREIFKTLKANGIVVIMQDLDARKDGVITNFLGLPASTHDGIIKLYQKFHCPIVPVHYVRDENNPAHHHAETPEILSDKFSDDAQANLEMCNNVIEKWIKDRPDLWLWLMDRWEYTLGKKI